MGWRVPIPPGAIGYIETIPMDTIALDIETTGTEPNDSLTVVGIDTNEGSRIMLNTDGNQISGETLDDAFAHIDPFVKITAHESEPALLETLEAFVAGRFDTTPDRSPYKFAAYNGERWRGGFDLPFLRTRCQHHDTPWPFDGPYIDVMDVVESNFNTSDNSLATAYRELVGDGLNGMDPFEDSVEAITAWESAEYVPLARHNLADIRRTRALVDVAERYCSKSHFNMRSLETIQG